jgi:hypothetical protein
MMQNVPPIRKPIVRRMKEGHSTLQSSTKFQGCNDKSLHDVGLCSPDGHPLVLG